MNHEYIIELTKIRKNDIRKAGGKGANLGEMIEIGIPVPPGFVVTTASFDRLIQINNLDDMIQQIIESTDVDDTSELLRGSRKIKELVLSCKMPPEIESKVIEAYQNLSRYEDIQVGSRTDLAVVAVRSSATAEDLPSASFAGQQATFLNIKGEKNLVESITKCWASLFEPRAIFYRAKHGFSRASIAVVVQNMINAEKSGTMFTVDPTKNEDIVLIEAIWGLGENIVAGEISPDSYKVRKVIGEREIVKKKAEAIIDIQVSSKAKMRIRDNISNLNRDVEVPKNKITAQVLTEKEILKLARYGIILEKHYGNQPQDIEFAINKSGEIAILQTRAITTKPKDYEVKGRAEVRGNKLLTGIGASPGIASGKTRIIFGKDDITRIEKGDIIVTTMTSPDLVPGMSKSAAIITDLGGRTCHAAIVSREMGIPAIVGTKNASRVLSDGQEVTVDAYDGIVYNGRIDLIRSQQQDALVETNLNSIITTTKTKVKVNLAFAHRLDEIAPKADGVGLLRIEHLVTQFGVHPAKLVSEDKQEEYMRILIEGIRPIAKAFYPKPVWVRTLDARSDEFRNLKGGEDEMQEANPMLGWHGIRRSLDEPALLRSEFQAIKKMHEQECLTNLQVMLPFVTSIEEVHRAKEIAREANLPLSAKIGIMVETPASVMIIEDLCKEGIAFASFGTNDLTQLVLGIDRNNERLAKMASPYHPAVLRSMKMVIDVCNAYGVETSICGESGSLSEMAKILVGYGIKSISCNMDVIATIRAVVYQEEQKLVSN
ncbi:MAG TPA: phosphoenolpyruvate synthase [Nitrososphaeraceae archaeon]|nr:phosphoenolpyruvate synthase [Nitrososphaeraceae archaeon]